MNKKLILLARIGAAQGIKGEVRVKPFGDLQMLDQYGRLEMEDGEKLKITRMRVQKSMAIVKFEGVNSRNEAEALNGKNLFVDRAKLPPPSEEEFYVSDLIGMHAVDADGERIGIVKDVPNFGAADMLEIDPINGSGTYYLPFTNAVIPEIDFKSGQLIVVPPDEVSERDDQEEMKSEGANGNTNDI